MKNIYKEGLALIFLLYASSINSAENFIDNFVKENRSKLISEYEYFIEHGSPSKTLDGFIERIESDWREGYSNQTLTLTGSECAFWLTLTQLVGSHAAEFRDGFSEHANYLYKVLIGEVPLSRDHLRVCRVWMNESESLSIINLIAEGHKFDGELISVKGLLYQDEGLTALFLTHLHFDVLDLSNAIILVDRDNLTIETHGEHVWIEGRYEAGSCGIPDNRNGCLRVSRLVDSGVPPR